MKQPKKISGLVKTTVVAIYRATMATVRPVKTSEFIYILHKADSTNEMSAKRQKFSWILPRDEWSGALLDRGMKQPTKRVGLVKTTVVAMYQATMATDRPMKTWDEGQTAL